MPPIRNRRSQRELISFNPPHLIKPSKYPAAPNYSSPSAATLPATPATLRQTRKSETERIPRPPNAFFIFLKEMRPKVKEKLTNYWKDSQMDVTVAIGQMWRDLPEDEQEHYRARAAEAAAEHAILHPGYKYRPRKPAVKKRGRRCSNTENKELRGREAVQFLREDLEVNSLRELSEGWESVKPTDKVRVEHRPSSPPKHEATWILGRKSEGHTFDNQSTTSVPQESSQLATPPISTPINNLQWKASTPIDSSASRTPADHSSHISLVQAVVPSQGTVFHSLGHQHIQAAVPSYPPGFQGYCRLETASSWSQPIMYPVQMRPSPAYATSLPSPNWDRDALVHPLYHAPAFPAGRHPLFDASTPGPIMQETASTTGIRLTPDEIALLEEVCASDPSIALNDLLTDAPASISASSTSQPPLLWPSPTHPAENFTPSPQVEPLAVQATPVSQATPEDWMEFIDFD